MKEFISQYQQTSKKFNEDIILNLRKNDDMRKYLEDIGRLVETVEYITFDGVVIEHDESKFKTRKSSPKSKGKNSKKDEFFWIPIKESRLSLATLHFSVNHPEGSAKIEIPIFIPKLISNFFYILNGNRYYAIYQNVDSSTYTNKGKITLKSLLMPIIVKLDKVIIEDTEGETYSSYVFKVDLFKKRINMLYYYFSKYGYEKTMKFFGVEDKIEILEDPSERKGYLSFKVNKKVYVEVSESLFNKKKIVRNMTACLIDILKGLSRLDKLDSKSYWKKKLGAFFSKNVSAQEEKAEKILTSFSRILDEGTKRTLRIDDRDKKNTFTIVRWIVKNYDTLMKRDNLSILNKRIRLNEYLIADLRRKFSTSVYRAQNSKSISLDKLTKNFNISPMYLVKTIVKSELSRYNNAVNNMDVFNCGLKYSNRGPQAMGSGSKQSVSLKYRDVHPSHIGKLALNSVSNSDPGMTGTLSPFIETDGFYYDTSQKEIDNK